jgi:hypothetical protein
MIAKILILNIVLAVVGIISVVCHRLNENGCAADCMLILLTTAEDKLN